MKPERSSLARIALAVAVLTTCVVVPAAYLYWMRHRAAGVMPDDPPPAASERAKRLTPVADIAPAPVATALPLLGPPGKDADGYPTQYVDRPALRSLLSHQRHDDLNRYFDELQSAFEADPGREYWPIDAGDAFASAEPELRAALDAWVAATPDSFAPYFARGTHWTKAAFARRGAKWAGETAPEDLDAMRNALAHAAEDLQHALRLRPKLVAARRQQLIAAGADGPGGVTAKPVLDHALAACPSCFQVRVTYIYGLTPRWGGTYGAMERFANQSLNRTYPRLRLLAGYADVDRADRLTADKKYDEAMTTIQRACALGEHWEFLFERAKTESAKGDLEAARKDLDRAAELRPGRPDVLFERAHVAASARRWEAAGRDLLEALRTEPTNSLGRHLLESVVQGLVYQGWEYHQAHRKEDALRLFDLAAELAPQNSEVQSRRAAIVTGTGPTKTPPEIAVLEAAAAAAPDDFRAHQKLDYALAMRGEYQRVVEMWNEYLAHHPDDGPAHLERGGAYYHLRMPKEARADAVRACDLGVSEGCARAKQLGGK